MCCEPAELVGKFVGALIGKLGKAVNSRVRPQCAFLSAPATAAFGVASVEPGALRLPQLLHRGRIAFSAYLDNERAINAVEALVALGELRPKTRLLVRERRRVTRIATGCAWNRHPADGRRFADCGRWFVDDS